MTNDGNMKVTMHRMKKEWDVELGKALHNLVRAATHLDELERLQETIDLSVVILELWHHDKRHLFVPKTRLQMKGRKDEHRDRKDSGEISTTLSDAAKEKADDDRQGPSSMGQKDDPRRAKK